MNQHGYQNYDKWPEKRLEVVSGDAVSGYGAICERIRQAAAGRGRTVIAVDCYPGVDLLEIEEGLRGLNTAGVFLSDAVFVPDSERVGRLPNHGAEVNASVVYHSLSAK